jgi:hypothetical protein
MPSGWPPTSCTSCPYQTGAAQNTARPSYAAGWRELARYRLRNTDLLTEWKVGFLGSILHRWRPIPRQADVFDCVVDKIEEVGRPW